MKLRCLFQISVVIFLLFPISASAIEWEKTYSYEDTGPDSSAVQQTADKGYIVAAVTHFLNIDFSIRGLKLDKEGNVVWQKTYRGIGGVWVSFIQQTPDKGYVVAGDNRFDFTLAPLEIWVLKLDSSGNVIWLKSYGVSDWVGFGNASSIQQTTDGGYIAAGGEVVFKLDSNGNVVWQKTYEGTGGDVLIQQAEDGGYIMVGKDESCFYGCISYPHVIKLDSSGNVIWERRYYTHRFTGYPTSFQKTADGGYIIMGYADVVSCLWVLKLDSKGDVVWQKTYRGAHYTHANSIQQTKDGGYIMAGDISDSPDTYYSMWVLKLDSKGRVIWSKTYEGNNQSAFAFSIEQTADGGYIMTGEILANTGNAIWVLKLDSKGSIPGCDIISESNPLVGNSYFFEATVTPLPPGEASVVVTPADFTSEDSEAIISSVCSGSYQY